MRIKFFPLVPYLHIDIYICFIEIKLLWIKAYSSLTYHGGFPVAISNTVQPTLLLDKTHSGKITGKQHN